MNKSDSIKMAPNPFNPGGAGGFLRGSLLGAVSPLLPLMRLFGYFLAVQKVTRGLGRVPHSKSIGDSDKNVLDLNVRKATTRTNARKKKIQIRRRHIKS